MQCPFLAETHVRNCHSTALARPIPHTGRTAEAGICTTAAHRQCPLFDGEPGAPAAARCPHLVESPMLYCTAAPVVKFIPYSQTEVSRCGNGRHAYCEVYLSAACGGSRPSRRVEGVVVPEDLYFTANHMWLDQGEDDYWHIGVDGFLAGLLGQMDRVSYLTTTGKCRPAAMLSVQGVDLHLAFPHEVCLLEPHASLRATPERVNSEPYGRGWLFEGQSPVPPGMRRGDTVMVWMRSEVGRMSRWVHAHIQRLKPELRADGGLFAGDLLSRLTPGEILSLFHDFFLPRRAWER